MIRILKEIKKPYIDMKTPYSIRDIHILYDEFNRKYFNSSCPRDIIIKYNKLVKTYTGKAIYEPGKPMIIILSEILENALYDMQDILLHEMIHIYFFSIGDLKQGHQGKFKAEIKRINGYGFNIQLEDDMDSREITNLEEIYYALILDNDMVFFSPQEIDIERLIEYLGSDNVFANEYIYIKTTDVLIKSFTRLRNDGLPYKRGKFFPIYKKEYIDKLINSKLTEKIKIKKIEYKNITTGLSTDLMTEIRNISKFKDFVSAKYTKDFDSNSYSYIYQILLNIKEFFYLRKMTTKEIKQEVQTNIDKEIIEFIQGIYNQVDLQEFLKTKKVNYIYKETIKSIVKFIRKHGTDKFEQAPINNFDLQDLQEEINDLVEGIKEFNILERLKISKNQFYEEFLKKYYFVVKTMIKKEYKNIIIDSEELKKILFIGEKFLNEVLRNSKL